MNSDIREQIDADIATLREIEARAQKAITLLQRRSFEAQSDEVRKVLREATSCLRLYGAGNGSREHVRALHRIVRILDPELYKLLKEEDYRQADRVTHPEEDDDE